MGKINKINTYAVLWLNSQSISTEDIAREISLTKKQVMSIIDQSVKSSSAENTIQTSSSQVSADKKSKIKDLMITESVGRRQNVTIMTKSASEVADEDRKSSVFNNTSKPYIWKQQ